jgi:cysteine synthase A
LFILTSKSSRLTQQCPLLGIGQGRLTSNLAPDLELLSGAVHVPDTESIKMVYRLLDEEGLYVGASSALNVVAAKMVAEKMGKGSTVVTMLCDGAYRSVVSPCLIES